MIGIRVLLASAILTAGCGLPRDEPAISEGSLATFRGKVLRLDAEQAYVDGPLIVVLELPDGSELGVYVSSCEGPCSRDANKTFHRLTEGVPVEVRGVADGAGGLAIFDASDHYLRVTER